jgi:hypothetical protein
MVVVAAVFAGPVTRSLVAQGVAASRRGGGWRRYRFGGSRRRRWRRFGGSCLSRWRGCWRRRRYCRRGTGRAGLGGGMRKGRRRRHVRLVAGIIGDVADLSAMADAPGRGRGHKVDGRKAFAGHVIPTPSAAKLAHLGRGAGLDYPDVDIARGRRSLSASMLGRFYGVRQGRGPCRCCTGRRQCLVRWLTVSARSAGNDAAEEDGADREESDVAPPRAFAARARRLCLRLSWVVIVCRFAHVPP